MSKAFVWDLETGPRDDAAQFLEEPQPPGNYKDAAKIAAYLEEKRKSQLERAALSAETARVLCVGVLRETSGVGFIHDEDESKLLTRAWEELGTFRDDEIFVTFNGVRFDWPMLVRRSYALGLRIPAWMPTDMRWRESRHCDLMVLWQCSDRGESISLDRLARLCGLPGKVGDGSDFARLWRENRAAALAYLTRDLELTKALWMRMK